MRDNLKDLKCVPYHKMGFKLLSDVQLENLFPNYNQLLKKISVHRGELAKMRVWDMPKDSQYNLMYDNVFSIMGKRGSGKTSVLFTLKNILENDENIVLPVIMPEIIPQECSMIGWILALMEETVQQLEEKLNVSNIGRGYFQDCKYKAIGSLQEEYERVKELCYSRFYEAKAENSFARAIANTEMQTQNSFQFVHKLTEFWDLLRTAIKIAHKLNGEPLIYLFFDDVDLTPGRMTDLLTTIIKYLSHPNIIVIVTADEEAMHDVIENYLQSGKHQDLQTYSTVGRVLSDYQTQENFEKDKILTKISHRMKSLQEMPSLYIDKILPPSSRYYLEYYESCESKCTFIEKMQPEEQGFKSVCLEEFFECQMERYLNSVGGTGEREIYKFWEYGGQFIKAYLLFWGNTSRKLANECFVLENFIDSLLDIRNKYKKDNENIYKKYLYHHIHQFMLMTLKTTYGDNILPNRSVEEVLEQLVVYQQGEWEIYLNYSYLKELTADYLLIKNVDIVKVAKKIIAMCVLLFLVENMLIADEKIKRPKKIHGKGILVDILDEITNFGYSLVCKDNTKDEKEFLFQYGELLECPQILMSFEITDTRKVRNYFSSLEKISLGEKCDLKNYQRKNPNWLRSITQLLYMGNECIYDITKRYVPLCVLNIEAANMHGRDYEETVQKLEESMIKSLCTPLKNDGEREENSEKILLELQELMEEIVNLYGQFSYYQVENKEKLEKLIQEAGVEKDISFDENKVDVKLMNTFLKWLAEEIISRKVSNTNMAFWLTGDVEPLEKLYAEICNNIEYARLDKKEEEIWENLQEAKQKFETKQKLYFDIFRYEKKKCEDNRINLNMIPYQNLYKDMKEILQGAQKKEYLGIQLEKYVKEGIEQYVKTLIEG